MSRPANGTHLGVDLGSQGLPCASRVRGFQHWHAEPKGAHARTRSRASAAAAASSNPPDFNAPLAQIEATIRRLGSGSSPALNEWNTHVWLTQPTLGSLHCIVGMHCVALWASVPAVASFHGA